MGREWVGVSSESLHLDHKWEFQSNHSSLWTSWWF